VYSTVFREGRDCFTVQYLEGEGLVYSTLFREGRYWCTVQYLERGGTGVPYSIWRGEGLVYLTVFTDGLRLRLFGWKQKEESAFFLVGKKL
jgi:hypothetical protein